MLVAVTMKTRITITLGLALLAVAMVAQQAKLPDQGFTDTPILPGLKWHVHDPARPHPPLVTPGATPGAPPSDAVVLFDGKDLSHWTQHGRPEVKWRVRDGYFE